MIIEIVIGCVLANILTVVILSFSIWAVYKKNEGKISEMIDELKNNIETVKGSISNVVEMIDKIKVIVDQIKISNS